MWMIHHKVGNVLGHICLVRYESMQGFLILLLQLIGGSYEKVDIMIWMQDKGFWVIITNLGADRCLSQGKESTRRMQQMVYK